MADFTDHFEYYLVFMWAPDLLALTETTDSSKPVQTLVFVTVFHLFCNDVPFLGMQLMQGNEPLVLLNSPGFD